MTIYKPGCDHRTPNWQRGEWGKRNALGKALCFIELPVYFVLFALAALAERK